MDWLVPTLIAAGLIVAVVAYWLQCRRDAQRQAEQEAADRFREEHHEIVRRGL